MLISGVVGADAYGDDPALGVATGLGAAVAYAGFLLVLRAGSADLRRTAWPLLDTTLAAAIASVAAGIAVVLGGIGLATVGWRPRRAVSG